MLKTVAECTSYTKFNTKASCEMLVMKSAWLACPVRGVYALIEGIAPLKWYKGMELVSRVQPCTMGTNRSDGPRSPLCSDDGALVRDMICSCDGAAIHQKLYQKLQNHSAHH